VTFLVIGTLQLTKFRIHASKETKGRRTLVASVGDMKGVGDD
jgi:hypothetical protein